jgi:hypothetical protein
MYLDEQNCAAKFFDARQKSQVIVGLLPRLLTQQREIWAIRLPFMIRSEAP